MASVILNLWFCECERVGGHRAGPIRAGRIGSATGAGLDRIGRDQIEFLVLHCCFVSSSSALLKIIFFWLGTGCS